MSKTVGLSVVGLAVVAFVVVCLWSVGEKFPAQPQPVSTSRVAVKPVTIDNPLIRGVPQQQEIGWAKVEESTSDGVLIRASVKVDFNGDKKGGTK